MIPAAPSFAPNHLPGLRFFTCTAFLVATAVALHAQPLARVAASSLRLPAAPPSASYSTANAFPALSFTQPVAVVTPPGESRRLFVVEKPGRIWVIPDVAGSPPSRVLFLDITTRVTVSTDNNDERGLLALTFHPDFATNGQFFVWYTTTATTAAGGGLHDRLSRFVLSATDPNAANPDSEQPLITQRDEAANHNGGELLFGPDGYLYVSLGDEGSGNDQLQNAQRIDRDFFSGILRLDVDHRPGSLVPAPHAAVHAGTYAIPPDNPFVASPTVNGTVVNAPVRTEFWAIGLRNPWRMAFDSATGQLWCGDVGQGAREEIDLIVPGGNYGWPYREGSTAGARGNPPAGAAFNEPIWDYPRSQGASVTGGFVYRGSNYTSLQGRYLFADFASGRIWALTPDGENPVASDRVQLLATDSGIASFGLNPATGDILVVGHLDDAIKRLVATTPSNAVTFPATLSATGAFADIATLAPAAGVVPYEPNVSFWSDHAKKRRWFALSDPTHQFIAHADLTWSHPAGAVWVKHFDLELTRGDASTARRIETRFLMKTTDGVYGLSYQWNDAQTDAVLVPDEGASQNFTVVENGVPRTQTWRFPSRAECLACHTPAGGHALSFHTRQLNRGDFLERLIASGYLSAPAGFAPATLPALARADDPNVTLEHRARSYLDANCSHCHQPGGTALGVFDARATLPLAFANLIETPLIDHGGDPANRVIVRRDPAHSHLLTRMSVRGSPASAQISQMPPIATHERDLSGEALLREWIDSLVEPTSPPSTSRLVNLAARGRVDSAGTPLIAGFVVSPGAGKRMLVRAIGGTLGTVFGVSGALEDPMLTVFGPDSSTRVAALNGNWSGARPSPGAAELNAAFDAAGAFRLPIGSGDAALVAQLAPGAYTAQVTAESGAGVTLVELYDLDAPPDSSNSASGPRLINLAVRAQVGTGDNILIPGITISPGGEKTLLIRAVGPGLAPFGVTGVLAAPSIALLSGAQIFTSNTRWSTAVNAAGIRATAERVGAFPLAPADSALLVPLSPGSYTLRLTGAGNTTGAALVEVYEVP